MSSKTVVGLSLVIALIVPVSLIPRPVVAQTELAATPPPEIEIGHAANATHGSGQAFQYRFLASQGQAYLVDVQQLGLDLTVGVRDPAGNVSTYNSPLNRDGPETILLGDAIAGEYLLTIKSDEPTEAVGGHVLRVSQLDSSDPDTRRYIGALSFMTHAAKEYATGDMAVTDNIFADYRQAEKIWRGLDRKRELARTLHSIAMLEYWRTYDWDQCAADAAAAAQIYAETGEHSLRANAIFLQGAAEIEAANELDRTAAPAMFESALGLLNEAREIHVELGNEYDAVQIQNTLGLAYMYKGDWDRARETWMAAAEEFGRLGEWLDGLRARQNIAVIDGMRGYNGRAIDVLQFVVDNLPDDAEAELYANVQDNLAENHRLYGNFDDALRLFNSALEIHREIGDQIGEAYSLNGIGNTYYSLGKLELASNYLEEALVGAVEANDGRSQESILSRLGDIAYLQNNYERALSFHEQALSIAGEGQPRARRQLAVARDLQSLNRPEAAMALALEASSLAEESRAISSYADAQVRIGKISMALGRPDEAGGHFEQALEVYESLGLRAGQAEALDGLATGASVTGHLDEAIRYGKQSLAYIESLREKLAIPELRAEYSAANRRYYESQIDRLMTRQQAETGSDVWLRDALETSENSRARMATDLMREVATHSRTRTESDVKARQRVLYEELAAKRYQRDRLLMGRSHDDAAREQVSSLKRALTELENELNVVATEVRRSDPAFGDLSADDTLTAEDMQSMLNKDELLLHYSLGDTRSFVWAITGESIHAVELADRDTIDKAVLQALDGLKVFDNRPSALRDLEASLEQLSEYIIAPIAGQLRGRSQLLLALDGSLQYVPFGALPVTIDGSPQRLVETHDIVSIPSLAMISTLRSRTKSPSDKTIAVFADPVISASDSRLAAARIAPDASTSRSDSVFEEMFPELRLGRLPSTAREAEVIREAVSNDERFVAEGFDAALSVINDLDLSDYRFVHFATHGVVDTQYPPLSALVFSRFDQQGSAQPGLLRLYDVFGLDLNAELVVLSACDTALGQEIRGEGMIGFAQGFMYAGTDGVLVSLWQVSDRATAEFMALFYRAILVEGLTAPKALSQAQRLLPKDRRWRHPYFWAPFVLAGDWR